MHFSRISLVDPAVARSVAEASAYGHHQKVWRFFADRGDRERDFVYRYDLDKGRPRYHIVSSRPPNADAPGWMVEERAYDPRIERGARLRFSLRANPAKRSAKPGERSDGKRHDVVMQEKRRLREAGSAVEESAIVQAVGFEWLSRQATQHGFSVEAGDVRVSSYSQHRFTRARDQRPISVSGLDFEGVLSVSDPLAFDDALRHGIGPAKGFGFGLLLVKRP